MRINESCRKAVWESGLVGFDDWMQVARASEKPSGRAETLVHFEIAGHNGFRVYLKRFRPDRLTFRFFLRRSRQRREAENATVLREIGVPTAEVVAAGERRRLGCVTEAFVATRGIPGATPLTEFAPVFGAERSGERRRVRLALIEKFASIVRRMHEAGYVDHDLYWRNILVSETPRGTHEFHVIDSPRGTRHVAGGRRGKLRDLACLHRDGREFLSRTDRARFMKVYLGRERLERADWLLCRRIDRRKLPRQPEKTP